MSGIRVNEWLHNSGTGGIWQTSAGNVGIASSVPTAKLVVTGDANISGVTTATAFVPSAGQLSNRNLVINGAMMVDQRYGGAAHTIDGSDFVLDRWLFQSASTQEQPTIQQVDVTADSAPWNAGFRKAAKITNGNQTGGAGGDDTIIQYYKFEAQDIATSGWDYTSDSSYVTFSFWVKASVAQDYPFYIRTRDGSAYMYSTMTGSLTANTWTKITKTIPGNSNITVNTDNGSGLELNIAPYYGTDGTVASGSTLDAWKAWTASSRWNDITTTWYTTNDATFETTGFQLEVGSVATPFEHRSYGDELARCQRYYYKKGDIDDQTDDAPVAVMFYNSGTTWKGDVEYPVTMRDAPSIEVSNFTDAFRAYGNSSGHNSDTLGTSDMTKQTARVTFTNSSHSTSNLATGVRCNATGAYLAFLAEL